MTAPLELTRHQILAFRRHAGALDERLPAGPDSLRRAAWAGLQDSMPRAALLSIHARVEGTQPSVLDDPALVQLWGPRFSAYVVAAGDEAPFTLGRLPDDEGRRGFAQQLADRLEAFLDGRSLSYAEAGRAIGVSPNALRYAAPTGRVLIRWEGAGRPTVRTVAPPDVDPFAARLELARRYLHVFGPSTPAAFAEWAGIKPPRGQAAFDALGEELLPARTPIGDGWLLASDEPVMRAAAGNRSAPAAPAGLPAVRLLPSGDTYYLLQGADRQLLVADAGQRGQLWTSRVWPGALLVGDEIVGTWRRSDAKVTVQAWRRLSTAEQQAVEAEAASLPLTGLRDRISLRWESDNEP